MGKSLFVFTAKELRAGQELLRTYENCSGDCISDGWCPLVAKLGSLLEAKSQEGREIERELELVQVAIGVENLLLDGECGAEGLDPGGFSPGLCRGSSLQSFSSGALPLALYMIRAIHVHAPGTGALDDGAAEAGAR